MTQSRYYNNTIQNRYINILVLFYVWESSEVEPTNATNTSELIFKILVTRAFAIASNQITALDTLYITGKPFSSRIVYQHWINTAKWLNETRDIDKRYLRKYNCICHASDKINRLTAKYGRNSNPPRKQIVTRSYHNHVFAFKVETNASKIGVLPHNLNIRMQFCCLLRTYVYSCDLYIVIHLNYNYCNMFIFTYCSLAKLHTKLNRLQLCTLQWNMFIDVVYIKLDVL